MNTKKALLFLLVVISLNGLIGCQSATQKSQVQPGQQVTLEGSLQQGSLTGLSLASDKIRLRPLGTPLANYRLYCVTFEDSPVGAKGTADNSGRFSLSIKSYTPFGCFVLDSTDKHVADLLFAGLGTTSETYSGSIMLVDNANVGTITVDPNTGMAVVNVAGVGGVAGSNITGTPFDPTGSWTLTCTSPTGDPVYSCPNEIPSSIYLHRISGIFSSDGKRHYGLSIWASAANFTVCGRVEGLSPTPDSTNAQGPGGQTVTLDRLDGPLKFAYDNVWQAVLDNQIKNTYGACGAPVTLTCSQVTNVANWCPPNSPSPFSPGQCQQWCYANAFYQIKTTPQLCIEDREYKWTNTSYIPSTPMNDHTNTQFVDFDGHKPAARHGFGELIYISNTSASVVSTEYRLESIYSPQENSSYECYINAVMKFAFSVIDSSTLTGTVDQYMTLAAGSPTQCTSTAIPNNYVLEDLKGMHAMFKLVKQ